MTLALTRHRRLSAPAHTRVTEGWHDRLEHRVEKRIRIAPEIHDELGSPPCGASATTCVG